MQDRQLISSGSPFEAKVGYSRAVRVGDHVIVAGTAPQWPDGHVDPDPEVQARRCFEIIGAALAEAGSGFADVVRTRVYLVDAADFARGRAGARRALRRGAAGQHQPRRRRPAQPGLEGGDRGRGHPGRLRELAST